MTRVARRERRPASRVPATPELFFDHRRSIFLHIGLIFALPWNRLFALPWNRPVPDLGYCREIVVTIAAVCRSAVGPSNVAYWPSASVSAVQRYFRSWTISGHCAACVKRVALHLVTDRLSAASRAAAPAAWRSSPPSGGPRRGSAGWSGVTAHCRNGNSRAARAPRIVLF